VFDTLTPIEARVLGVLIEKENLVPGTYPMSLTGVWAGCIQKTNRNPYMFIFQTDVQLAIDTLLACGYIKAVAAPRVTRYSHNIATTLKLPAQAIPLLGVLLLRGPQTASEMRLNTERMHKFANIETIEGFMRMMSRDRDEPLVSKVPRQSGEREDRWGQLLTGPLNSPKIQTGPTFESLQKEIIALKSRIEVLEEMSNIRLTDQ
jgi:uncharacterized protein